MKFHNIPRLTEAKSNNSSDILLDKQKEINNNLLEQYFKEKTLEKSAKMRKIKGY